MHKLAKVLKFAVVAVALCRVSSAADEYVIVNSNNSIANNAILYLLNQRTGKLTRAAKLNTGGQAFDSFPIDFFQVQEAVGAQASCIFALDTGSSDIAAFSKTLGYKRVGRYFDKNLITGENGGSISLTPNGEFLYALYYETSNIALWSVSQDCTLSLVAVYPDNSAAGPVRVTPNGKYLIVSGTADAAFLYSINQADGTLTSLGSVAFNGGACSRENPGCATYSVDITRDSRLVIFASAAPNISRDFGIPVALTARITSSGFVNPRAWVLTRAKGWDSNMFPFLSYPGYTGSGDMYFGSWHGDGNAPPGVITVTFTEAPMSFRFKNSSLITNAPLGYDGNIAVTGNLMVVAQYADQISVFRILKNGSLKLLSTTTIDEQGEGLFSLSIFPNTR